MPITVQITAEHPIVDNNCPAVRDGKTSFLRVLPDLNTLPEATKNITTLAGNRKLLCEYCGTVLTRPEVFLEA